MSEKMNRRSRELKDAAAKRAQEEQAIKNEEYRKACAAQNKAKEVPITDFAEAINALISPKGSSSAIYDLLYSTLEYYASTEDNEKAIHAINALAKRIDLPVDIPTKEEALAYHVDDWLDLGRTNDEGENYARFFLELDRMPAYKKFTFDRFTSRLELYCTYEHRRYRVTGASSMGCIYIQEDLNRSDGYTKGVDVRECSEWYHEVVDPASTRREIALTEEAWDKYCVDMGVVIDASSYMIGTSVGDVHPTVFCDVIEFLSFCGEYKAFRITSYKSAQLVDIVASNEGFAIITVRNPGRTQ